MATIFLIRHGQASFGMKNYDELSPIGFQQASKLGDFLKTNKIFPTKIIQGDMVRHKQTADFCMKNLELEGHSIETISNWNEFDHRDILTQYEQKYQDMDVLKMDVMSSQNPKEKIQEILTGAIKKWTETDSGSYNETWIQFCTRINEGLNKLTENSNKEDIIFVFTSGGAISIALMEILGLNIQRTFDLQLSIANASITQIKNTSKGWKLISFNNHSHFLGKNKQLLTYK